MSVLEFSVVEPGIGRITLNRPEKRNAVNAELRHALVDALESDELAGLRVVVIHGHGAAFCAGVDLGEVGRPGPDEGPGKGPGAGTRLFTALRQARPVLLASVHGYALGLGSGIAVACDVVVAAQSAQFGYPEIQHDLVAAITMMGLREVAGPRRAMELLVTGRRVPAGEAQEIGLVTHTVRDDQLAEYTMQLARSIAGHATVALHATKKLFYDTAALPYGEAIAAGEEMVRVARAHRGAQAKAAAFVSGQS